MKGFKESWIWWSENQQNVFLLLLWFAITYTIFNMIHKFYRKVKRNIQLSVSDYISIKTESSKLAAHTNTVRKHMDLAHYYGMVVNPADMEILQEAEEWDMGIQIGLAAWWDVISPTTAASLHLAANEPVALMLREQQGKLVAQRMVTQCSKALQQRMLLTLQLQRMQREVAFRWSFDGPDKWTTDTKMENMRSDMNDRE